MGNLENITAASELHVPTTTFYSSQPGTTAEQVQAVLHTDLPSPSRSPGAVSFALSMTVIGFGTLMLSVLIKHKRVPHDSPSGGTKPSVVQW